MRFKPANAATVADVLRRFADQIDEMSRAERKDAAKVVNEWLDELLSHDAFGTEGQCDPRGDHRS